MALGVPHYSTYLRSLKGTLGWYSVGLDKYKLDSQELVLGSALNHFLLDMGWLGNWRSIFSCRAPCFFLIFLFPTQVTWIPELVVWAENIAESARCFLLQYSTNNLPIGKQDQYSWQKAMDPKICECSRGSSFYFPVSSPAAGLDLELHQECEFRARARSRSQGTEVAEGRLGRLGHSIFFFLVKWLTGAF